MESRTTPSRARRLALVGLAAALLAPALALPAGAQAERPPSCYDTNLNGYPQYSLQAVRAVWDQMLLQSQGVCRVDKPAPMPGNMASGGPCRFIVELGTPEYGTSGWLCWFGKPAQGLRTTLGAADVQSMVNAALAVDGVGERLGSGRHVVEFDIAGETFTVIVEGGRVTSVVGAILLPPKCYSTLMTSYPQYQEERVKRAWDAALAQSLGVCRWDLPDRPMGACNMLVELGTVEYGVTSWLCWYGKAVRVQVAGYREAWDFRVAMTRDAALAVINSGVDFDVVKRLLASRGITIQARDPAVQAALRLAMAGGAFAAQPFAGNPCQFATLLLCAPNGGSIVYGAHGAPIGHMSPGYYGYGLPPPQVPVFYSRPPGVLAQNPGLVYDTVTSKDYVLGPHNVFQKYPGLVSPNEILAGHTNLIGPADIGLLNPNLVGAKEFAYLLGIGAHSKTSQMLFDHGWVNDPWIGSDDRWGLHP